MGKPLSALDAREALGRLLDKAKENGHILMY
jgi:hypothetical protein